MASHPWNTTDFIHACFQYAMAAKGRQAQQTAWKKSNGGYKVKMLFDSCLKKILARFIGQWQDSETGADAFRGPSDSATRKRNTSATERIRFLLLFISKYLWKTIFYPSPLPKKEEKNPNTVPQSLNTCVFIAVLISVKFHSVYGQQALPHNTVLTTEWCMIGLEILCHVEYKGFFKNPQFRNASYVGSSPTPVHW